MALKTKEGKELGIEGKVNGKMSYQELLDITLEVKWVDGAIEIYEIYLKYVSKMFCFGKNLCKFVVID